MLYVQLQKFELNGRPVAFELSKKLVCVFEITIIWRRTRSNWHQLTAHESTLNIYTNLENMYTSCVKVPKTARLCLSIAGWTPPGLADGQLSHLPWSKFLHLFDQCEVLHESHLWHGSRGQVCQRLLQTVPSCKLVPQKATAIPGEPQNESPGRHKA